ncbi:PLP-dependent aminotransferase family protein [Aeribacillus pallidus]|uniref:GntR family transcriptional regulator n=1 Tax=Aeribacillus pallidus TaxID=33936 RepID=A0A223E4A0_9BACI|nr:PLP-dependent aminotransferase family protein [Aeribacillus pallidus]ASS90069.1 GntR family transcriptional regulator [Aeribacillus pallidus]
MQLSINKKLGTPYYEQISRQIEERIQSGMLLHGERLPSLRSLANELNVSFLTVQKAYKLLELKGYIQIQQGKGVFVAAGKKKSYEKHSESFGWQHQMKMNGTRSQYLAYREKEIYDFSQAVVYPRLLPSHFLVQEMKKILEQHPLVLSTYGPIEGDEELRYEIANYLFNFHHLSVKHDKMIITSGAQQGIDLVAQTLLSPGDVVMVESPCYGAAIDVFVNKGFQVVSIGVDEEGLKVDELEDKLQVHQPKLLYVNPTFQNPTGTCMPEKSRKQLVELAEMYHFLILEDDSFSEVSFDNITVPKPIKFFDKNGHVIYLKGFSKTTAPGIRIAAVIVDGVLFDWLYGTKATMDIGSPLLPQKALLPILRTERMKNHMEKLKIALELRRNTVLDAFKNLEEVMIYKPKGGLNAWIKLPSMIQPIKLQEAARKNKISYLPGSACFLHEPKQHYIRISYSYLSEHDLQVGIEKLVDILQNMMANYKKEM